MPIQAPEGRSADFSPHPPGSYMAVCSDIFVETVENKFYNKPKSNGKLDTDKEVTKVVLVFLTTEPIESDGQLQPRSISLWCTLKWGTPDYPSKLKTFVKGWFPTATDAHLAILKDDLERLIGKGAYIGIEHNVVGDKTYANITTAMPPPAGATIPMIPVDYVRHIDKPKDVAAPAQQQAPAQAAPPVAQPSAQTPKPDLMTGAQAAAPLQQPVGVSPLGEDDLPF